MAAPDDRTEQWLQRSTVRNGEMPTIRDSEVPGNLFFSDEYVPIVRHPLVVARGTAMHRELLIQHLFSFMTFTDQLELSAVNPIAQRVALGNMDIRLPPEVREEAHQIVTDEAWHAQICHKLLQQISRVTGLLPACPSRPMFLDRLQHVQDSLPRNLRDLSQFFFVVVSETMISGTLSCVPKDPTVVPAVRKMLGDHAIDEGRHHKFFSSLFGQIWPALTMGQRQEIASVLPRFIRAFIDPDKRAIKSMLAAQGFSQTECHRIVHETFVPSQLDIAAREASRATVSLFERYGVLDDSRAYDAFAAAGLIG